MFMELQIPQRKNLLHARMKIVTPDGNFRVSRYMFLGLKVFYTANLKTTWFHVEIGCVSILYIFLI